MMTTPIRILRTRGIRPRKRLGQSFLQDLNIVNKIVDFADIQPDETVVEIGAGLGTMTGLIAVKARRVVALDVDPIMIGILGFCAMTLQLVSLYSFQAFYGSVYSMIGLLTAVFMSGLSLGSYTTSTRAKGWNIEGLLSILTITVMIFTVFLTAAPGLGYMLSAFIIPLFMFIFAFISGSIFPLAVGRYRTAGLEASAGIIYGADLMGGAISAVFSSLTLLPSYGLIGCCTVSASLCIICLLLSYSSS